MTHALTSLPNRRTLLLGGAALFLTSACTGGAESEQVTNMTTPVSPNSDWMKLSEADWRTRLTPMQFNVLRKEATERSFTSPLNEEKRAGIYHCAGCDLPLFSSETKYESGTGWPSFWQPLDGALGTKPDNTLWMTRTEYHCIQCHGHQGHVFKDGPPPTGLRYCNNGVALTFRSA